MSIAIFIYAFLLFFVLTPGILISLPPKRSKIIVALTHAFIFALVWNFTHKLVWSATAGLFEGLKSMVEDDDKKSTPAGKKKKGGNDKSDEGEEESVDIKPMKKESPKMKPL
jgi:hypothetical protein